MTGPGGRTGPTVDAGPGDGAGPGDEERFRQEVREFLEATLPRKGAPTRSEGSGVERARAYQRQQSQYMLGVTEKALVAGMNVIRYNQRNCGGTDALAPVLYHSGLSSDVAAVANEIIARDGITRLALVGFSMGGNIVLKLAGEWASQPPPQFRAVAVCCPAIDLAPSADTLHEPSNRIYEKYFCGRCAAE